MYEILVFDTEKTPLEIVKYTIEKYVEHEEKEHRLIVLPCKGRHVVVHEEEIYYIEGREKETLVHLKEETVVAAVDLGIISACLQRECSVRCHERFVVNLEKVFSYGQTEFVLRNGEQIPISHSRIAEVKEAFNQWAILNEG